MRILLLALLTVVAACRFRDSVEVAIEDTVRFAREGRYEEALQRHIWLHDHALDVNPNYYGVRLAMLGPWVELGQRHPPALRALRSIRDEKTARLLAGESERALFGDVAAINEHVGDVEATIMLFQRIDADNPTLARAIFQMAYHQLIDEEHYHLAKKYAGDPNHRFALTKRVYERRSARASDKQSPELREACESIFVRDVVALVTLLDQTGDRETAAAIRAEALKTLDHPAIRGTMKQGSTEQ